jgi:hypothetical protein
LLLPIDFVATMNKTDALYQLAYFHLANNH